MMKQDETTAQVSDIEGVFSRFDENGDGKISPAELQQCLKVIGQRLPMEEIEEIVANIDADGDGLVTCHDVVCFVEGCYKEDRSESNDDLRDAFKLYDRLHDSDFVDTKSFGRRAIRRLMRYCKLKNLSIEENRGTNQLPVSQKDLENIALEQKAVHCTAIGRMLNISPKQYGMLLMLSGGIISYLARNSTTTTFEFEVGKTTNTSQSLLSFHEAIFAFIPEMAHIAVFMICYILTLVLVLPLHAGVEKIIGMMLLLFAPLFYFPNLVRKASTLGVDVACGGSFKLSLIGFTSLAAFGITLSFGLLTLLVVYLNRIFIQDGKPTRGEDIELNSNDLLECLSNL